VTRSLEGVTVILGAGGFLGTALRKSLMETPGVKYISTTHQREVADASGYLWLDVRNRESVVAALDRIGEYKPRKILNLISLGVSPYERDIRSEDVGCAREYAQLLSSKVRESGNTLLTLVNVSTENIYEFQDSYSQTSRVIHEELAQCRSSIKYVNVSLPRVFGPGEPRGRFLSDLSAAIKESSSFEIEEPDRIRRLVHIDDVVTAISRLLTIGESSLIDVVQITNQSLFSILSSTDSFEKDKIDRSVIKIGNSRPIFVGPAPYTKIYQQTERHFLHRLKCLLDN